MTKGNAIDNAHLGPHRLRNIASNVMRAAKSALLQKYARLVVMKPNGSIMASAMKDALLPHGKEKI